jgi:hypothetical protein
MIGECKLTRTRGRFVDAHLIPKALTKPSAPGLAFAQIGQGKPPKRRWSSWYDPRLVTSEGEGLLKKLDTWAISELRRKKLVWSGWEQSIKLNCNDGLVHESGFGMRNITEVNWLNLRLFLLSLLWRGGATNLPEFSEIRLPQSDLDQMRQLLVREDFGELSFYPAILVQLSTRGFRHNFAPMADTIMIKGVAGEQDKKISTFRFYFDGLIVHFLTQGFDQADATRAGPGIVGGGDSLLVPVIPFERSFHNQNLFNIVATHPRPPW